MNKHRICHVSTVHRGVEIRIIRKELASLAAAGYEAHAVIAATPAEVAEAAQLDVTIHALTEQPGSGRLARMTRKMYAAWQQCRQVNAGLYHFHDPELIPLGLMLKLSGHRVVMDVHEDLANQILTKHWIPARLRKVVARLARTAERIGARFFDGVVTASPRQAVFFEDVARRVVVAHNYPLLSELAATVDTTTEAASSSTVPTMTARVETGNEKPSAPSGQPVRPPASTSSGPSTGKLPETRTAQYATDHTSPDAGSHRSSIEQRPATHVAYVGGISRIRGINEAVMAIEKADVRLILAGKFKTEQERQEASALPGWQRVEDLGWVDRNGIANALQRSFAGLCTLHPTPNHLNAEPIKLFEYMAAGIPSIVSTIPDWMPYVERHHAGLCVDPMDVDAIARAIIHLRDNPELATEMGRNGQRAVLEHYNWSTQALKLEALYAQILAKQTDRP
ncbi:MAG: glycosyltransferase [Lautropia sp.]|nr:glycosyltransferase [Lautropia sp.]